MVKADSVLLYLSEEGLAKMQDSSNKQFEDDRMFDLCSHVISLDRAIMFCALAHKSGYLIALASSNKTNRHRGLVKNEITGVHGRVGIQDIQDTTAGAPVQLPTFLTEVELEKYIFQAGIIWGIHKLWERKLGHVRHIVSYYDEIPLATIFLDNNHFLLTGIDSRAKSRDIDKLVSKKILPSLGKFSMLTRQE